MPVLAMNDSYTVNRHSWLVSKLVGVFWAQSTARGYYIRAEYEF